MRLTGDGRNWNECCQLAEVDKAGKLGSHAGDGVEGGKLQSIGLVLTAKDGKGFGGVQILEAGAKNVLLPFMRKVKIRL